MMTLRQPAQPPVRLAGRAIGLTIYGGALAVGALAALVDARGPGVRAELLATGVLSAAYLASIVAVVRSWLRAHPHVRTLADFLALTPEQFELAIADLLGEAGYREVRRIGGAGDLGADLLCRDARGRRVVVQCKRYAPERRVGSQAVQTFIGMASVHHHGLRGIFVTTSDFTAPAIELAREHDLLLIDGEALVALAQGIDAGGAYQLAPAEDVARA